VDSARLNRYFKLTLGITLLIKLALASWLPMTGDEAYFALWGRHPDYGFYDHPPMIGWILAAMLQLGQHPLIVRLPTVLLTTFVGWCIYRLLRERNTVGACLVAILYLVSPINLLGVLVTTDTPLILFSLLSTLLLYRALQDDGLLYYALSGMALGLAFLSKYFAVLLGLAYLTYFATTVKTPARLRGLMLLIACSLPFAGINLYWNYAHCWSNIMFNLFNRNIDAAFSPGHVLFFVLVQIYLITPPVLFYFYRQKTQCFATLKTQWLFACAFLVPMAAYAVLSFKKIIGVHWVLSFYPFFYILLFFLLDEKALKACTRFMVYFSAAHLMLIAAFALAPLSYWKDTRYYPGLVMMFETDKLVDQLEPYQDHHWATNGYVSAAMLSFYTGRDVSVFGDGAHHARQDDILTDFNNLDGRSILILRKSEPKDVLYKPYFKSTRYRTLNVEGATFYLVEGKSFDYPKYRDQVLGAIRHLYYAIPSYLPQGGCYFCAKYFGQDTCSSNAETASTGKRYGGE
jgi:hypothetical protein